MPRPFGVPSGSRTRISTQRRGRRGSRCSARPAWISKRTSAPTRTACEASPRVADLLPVDADSHQTAAVAAVFEWVDQELGRISGMHGGALPALSTECIRTSPFDRPLDGAAGCILDEKLHPDV